MLSLCVFVCVCACSCSCACACSCVCVCVCVLQMVFTEVTSWSVWRRLRLKLWSAVRRGTSLSAALCYQRNLCLHQPLTHPLQTHTHTHTHTHTGALTQSKTIRGCRATAQFGTMATCEMRHTHHRAHRKNVTWVWICNMWLNKGVVDLAH